MALVSILVPSFNRDDLISETLDSLAAQTFERWEAIVVDDGSTDRTREVVAEYAARDARFKIYDRSRGPKGACTCRNEGVALSSGDYLLFLDTDDIIEPFCLEQRVAAMEAHPDLDFAIFPSLMFETTPHDLGLWWNVDKPEDELTRQFRLDGICQGTGVLWRRAAFERIGMWDESLRIWQDVDLFLRSYIQDYRYAKFFDLPPDLHNRITPNSLSRGGYHQPEKTGSRVAVIQQSVRMLKAYGKAARVREARYLTASIVSGAAHSGQFVVAGKMLSWAAGEGVLSWSETLRLRLAVGLRLLRLNRLPGVGRLIAAIEDDFRATSTIACLPRDRAAALATPAALGE